MTGKSTLSNIFSFFNHGGDHYFQEKRMILSSTDAWGVLRKDLIDTLGIQRAKRFLLRYGWHCGKNEARMLKDMVEWENEIDWLVAGSKMHQIGGRVLSYPEEFNVDMEKGLFNVSGCWIDSYEAKQHLQHYPLYHEPICYFLMGYGGGYNSECLGKKVIFKETHCVGKGDKHCRYVAKTVEEWGAEIADELINYEEQDIADELDIVYRRVEKQSEILHIGSSITKNLTSALLQGKGMDVFAELLSKELKMPVYIQNQYFDHMAHYFYEHHAHEMQPYDMGKIDAFVKKQFSNRVLTQTEQFEIEENGNVLISPIIIENDVYGYISIYREERKFGDAETDFLERAASICAVKMLNERTAIQTEEKMKGDLLEALFKGESDPAGIIKRFSYYGYNINQPHYVLIMEFPHKGLCSNSENTAANKNASKAVMEFFNREETYFHTNFIKLEKLNKTAILIPADYLEKKKTTIKDFAKHCYKLIGMNGENSLVYIGVSKLCTDAGQYSKRFKEATKAIEVAKAKNRLMNGHDSCIVHADELGHIMILLDARKPEELLAYAHEFLADLKAYDEKNSSELVRTLYYYIENECNLHKTAREMNVSISGMRYRISRIQELMDVDLSKASSKFEIQLSLQTYMVFNLL